MGGMGGNNVRLRSGKSGVKMYDLDASTAVAGGKMTPNNVSQYLRKRRAKRVYGSLLYHHRSARARCCNKILESCFPGTISVNKRAIAL